MKLRSKSLFWPGFLSFLCLILMFQTAFGQGEIKHLYTPYMILPFLIFFFLHNKAFHSINLCLFIGTLFSAFSPLSAPVLVLLFISLFLSVLFIKQIFFYKSGILFFSLVFLFSLLLPSLARLTQETSKNYFFFLNSISFVKALTTLVLSVIFFPFLKKYLKRSERAS